MTCREVADFIMDYLAGVLPSDVGRAFEYHLTLCADCRHYLAAYRAATELGRKAFEDEQQSAADAGVPEGLIAAILAARIR